MVKSSTRNIEMEQGAKIPKSRAKKKHESVKDTPETTLSNLFSDSVEHGARYDRAVSTLEHTYNLKDRGTPEEIAKRAIEIEKLQTELIELQGQVNIQYETVATRLVAEYTAGTITPENAASVCGLLSRTQEGPDMPYFDVQRASEWSQPFRDAKVGETVLAIAYIDVSSIGNGTERNYSSTQMLRDSPVVGILAAPPTLDLGDDPQSHDLQPKIVYELQSGDTVTEDLGMRMIAGAKADDFVALWLSSISKKRDEKIEQDMLHITLHNIRKVSQDYFRLRPLSDKYPGLKEVEAALDQAITAGLTSDMRDWIQYLPSLARLAGADKAKEFIPPLMAHYIVRTGSLDPVEIVAASLVPTHDVVDRYSHPDIWLEAEGIVNAHRLEPLPVDPDKE